MKQAKSAAAQRTLEEDPRLGGLARRLRQWRARQRSKGTLPQWVWDRAAEEAREHGVSRVARVLRLDYYQLKRRVAALALDAGANGAPPGFVELSVRASPPLPGEWTLELSDAQGRKLTLRAPSEPAAWSALARTFWEEGQ